MTKKHFEAFARKIKNKQEAGIDMTEAKELICEVAWQFNHDFNEYKFKKACQTTFMSEAK